MRIKYTFDEVKLTGQRRWKDETGKWKYQKKTFGQTLNPFNVNAEGVPKTRKEIYVELHAEIDRWKEEVK